MLDHPRLVVNDSAVRDDPRWCLNDTTALDDARWFLYDTGSLDRHGPAPIELWGEYGRHNSSTDILEMVAKG
jgi:hypothetical protein